MIKYYTYYSCGGYKDIYIGSDQDSADASYFIPLLNVWKKNNKPENADKIARAERVQHVELISKSNSAGFPSECNLMFSHGGYKAILRTLKDGRQCFAIRDISNGAKDEEGRDIPFNFLFLADDQESIEKLDALAISYLFKSNEINEIISNAIAYDPVINGVRFDLVKFNQLLTNHHETPKRLLHKAGTIDYLKISSRNQYKLSLTEQALDSNNVTSLWDDLGLFCGNLRYVEEPSKLPEDEGKTVVMQNTVAQKSPIAIIVSENKHEDSDSDYINTRISKINPMEDEENPSNGSSKDSVLSKPNLESQIQQIRQSLSLLATSEALDNLQSLLKNISNESNSVLSNIQEQLNKQLETTGQTPTTPFDEPNRLPHLRESVIIALGALIVGFILGALIF